MLRQCAIAPYHVLRCVAFGLREQVVRLTFASTSKCEIDENLLVINDWNKSNTGDDETFLMIFVGDGARRRLPAIHCALLEMKKGFDVCADQVFTIPSSLSSANLFILFGRLSGWDIYCGCIRGMNTIENTHNFEVRSKFGIWIQLGIVL